MTDTRLHALSPLDGRYADKCADLAALFSEAALIRHRVRVEAAWFLQLAKGGRFAALAGLPAAVPARVEMLARGVEEAGLARVKEIERQTNHDVKAVEYFVREQLAAAGAPAAALEFVHFACTSEDVNNLSYALMLREARSRVLLPAISAVADRLAELAADHAGLAMLSRTHGQPASPTTLGKELANVVARLRRAAESFARVEVLGKFNGAVGNFNAHVAAEPAIDWRRESRQLVTGLGLVPNEHTTQIEPHDWIAEYCDALARADTVLVDFCRDAWGYVSLGYFAQAAVAGEVGSSTMPHKVNPILFENAEGNAGVANALLRHFSEKLPVSRWQRDLTDSTVLRNLGSAFGHALLAWRSALAGLSRIQPDAARIARDLDAHWEVLAEAIQTVLRAHGVEGGYEKLKDFTRGRDVGAAELRAFVATLGLPVEVSRRLEALSPAAYTGLAEALARAL
ncbi:MAG TPA: adenylosuccinate lyase [Steroidobacteraceae bacterium]|jgi:adenylosuccinate lyase|nr:adenylosuccinate lyase [Steroidobacteraceae bacterium]